MRLTQFQELMDEEFGRLRSGSMLIDHVLTDLDGQTAAQALEAGVEPRDIWRALCRDFEVPKNRW